MSTIWRDHYLSLADLPPEISVELDVYAQANGLSLDGFKLRRAGDLTEWVLESPSCSSRMNVPSVGPAWMSTYHMGGECCYIYSGYGWMRLGEHRD